MSFSLNKIMLIGNLGQDAEIRFTQSNTKIVTFTLATTHGYKDNSDNWVNETTWHNVTGFNISDFILGNLKKGKKIYVEGRIQKGEYVDKDGVKRYPVNIICEKIILLEKSNEGNSMYSKNSDVPDSSNEDDDDLPF